MNYYKISYKYRFKEPSDTTKEMSTVLYLKSETSVSDTEALREFYNSFSYAAHHIIAQEIEKINFEDFPK